MRSILSKTASQKTKKIKYNLRSSKSLLKIRVSGLVKLLMLFRATLPSSEKRISKVVEHSRIYLMILRRSKLSSKNSWQPRIKKHSSLIVILHLLTVVLDITTMSVIPKFPSSDQAQITDKFKEHELRLSIMESKLKEFDTKFL